MSDPLPARRSPTTAPLLALLGVTAVWGSTFVVVKDAIGRMPVTDFLTWRFGLATLAMLAVRPLALRRLPARGARAGVLLGVALAAGYLLQTLGLQTTPASVSGFLTGLFVVLTPLGAALLLGTPPGRTAWLAVGLATVGLGLLSLRGLSIGGGELLTLLCAAAFALHIVGLGRWASRYDAYGLAVLQLGTTTVVCALVAVPGGLAVPPDAGVWAALALTSVVATALAFVVQTWAQATLSPDAHRRRDDHGTGVRAGLRGPGRRGGARAPRARRRRTGAGRDAAHRAGPAAGRRGRARAPGGLTRRVGACPGRARGPGPVASGPLAGRLVAGRARGPARRPPTVARASSSPGRSLPERPSLRKARPGRRFHSCHTPGSVVTGADLPTVRGHRVRL